MRVAGDRMAASVNQTPKQHATILSVRLPFEVSTPPWNRRQGAKGLTSCDEGNCTWRAGRAVLDRWCGLEHTSAGTVAYRGQTGRLPPGHEEATTHHKRNTGFVFYQLKTKSEPGKVFNFSALLSHY